MRKAQQAICFDEDWQTYLNSPELNASTAVHGIKSMKHLRHAQLNPRRDTAAMLVGRLGHSLIECLGNLDAHYAVMPPFERDAMNTTAKGDPSTSKATAYYKKAAADWHKANPDKEVVSQEVYDQAKGICDAVLSDSVAGQFVNSDYCNREVSLYGEIEGVPCKGRVDGLLMLGGSVALVDTKTTASIEPRAFGRKFADLFMAFRLEFYRQLLAANDCKVAAVYIIAVEQTAPHDVAVVPVPLEYLDNETSRVQTVVRDYATCLEHNAWPGVAGGEELQLQVPSWALPEGVGLVWEGVQG